MKNFAEQLIEELQQQLTPLLPLIEEDPIQNCQMAIRLLLQGYDQLKNVFIKAHLTPEQEIDFFKNTKPPLTSQIIYFNELFIIEHDKPVATEKTIRKYYNAHLKKREQFFMENAEFYKYYRKGHNYLDDKYFLRNQTDTTFILDSFYFQIDTTFATSHEYKLAQLLANEQLQNYLTEKLKPSEKNETLNHHKVLKWTASKAGVIELIYALHTAGVFNHGACDVKEIAKGFGKAFDIDIGQFHRTFNEITNRKSERTKFLTMLQEKLKHRMNQADA